MGQAQPDPREDIDEIDAIIERGTLREDIFRLIPENSRRILDFGCGQGSVLLRLKRDKNCSELYGVDIEESCRPMIERHLDGAWIMDLGREENDIPDEFEGFFDFILMHDVVEHLYDPWLVLSKLNRFLSPEGHLIVVTPNFRFYSLWNAAAVGNFRYGVPGGLLNEGHIRWFTPQALAELAEFAGLDCLEISMLFPPNIDWDVVSEKLKHPIPCFEIPPPEIAPHAPRRGRIEFAHLEDLRSDYLQFLANKIMMIAKRIDKPLSLAPVHVGDLHQRRRDMLARKKRS